MKSNSKMHLMIDDHPYDECTDAIGYGVADKVSSKMYSPVVMTIWDNIADYIWKRIINEQG